VALVIEISHTVLQEKAIQTLLTAKISGEEAELARRYANALYDLAESKSAVDAVVTDAVALATLWQQADVSAFFKNPRLQRSVRVKAMQAVAAKAGMGEIVANLACLLAQNGRVALIPSLVRALIMLVAEKQGVHHAVVRSAQPMTTAQIERLTGALMAMVSGKVVVSVQQDASLLGGFTVRIGDQLIDRSVSTALQQVEHHLYSTKTTSNMSQGAA
jgi:F-type H+-transporting ATPase subunit delta